MLVGAGVAVGVGVGVAVGAGVAVGRGVLVAVGAGVRVGVGTGGRVAVAVGEGVAVTSGVGVGVVVGVGVSVGLEPVQASTTTRERQAIPSHSRRAGDPPNRIRPRRPGKGERDRLPTSAHDVQAKGIRRLILAPFIFHLLGLIRLPPREPAPLPHGYRRE